MLLGMYSAASGMIALEARQDVVANNVANASTPGFKRQEAVLEGFAQVFSKTNHQSAWFVAAHSPGGGPRIAETVSDQAQGMLLRTDNPLNAALQGPGYIGVETPQGERFTRNGQFTIDASGQLVTQDGYTVQSVAGAPIDVRGGRVEIQLDGTVQVDGLPAGQIRVVEFSDPKALRRMGDSLYRATELAQAQPAAETEMHAEYIEASNVSVPSEMLNLMLGARAYEANSRLVQAMEESMGRLIDRVAMPQ